jgi:uncharacterized membrane protein
VFFPSLSPEHFILLAGSHDLATPPKEAMMGHIEHSVHINRPIDEVFAYVNDPSRMKEWNLDLVDAYADGPLRVGTRLTQVRSLLGQRIEATAEVTALDPPNSMSVGSVGGGMITMTGTFLFEAMGEGTHFTMSMDIAPSGVLKIAEGAFVDNASKNMQQNLATLKQILES